MPQRTGKIARLPCDIPKQLNQGMRGGQAAAELITWLRQMAEELEPLAGETAQISGN